MNKRKLKFDVNKGAIINLKNSPNANKQKNIITGVS